MPDPTRDYALESINAHLWKGSEGSWAVIIKWCRDNDRTVACFLNTMIPAISFCIQNYTTADPQGNPQVELNLGKLTFAQPKKGMRWQKKKVSQ